MGVPSPGEGGPDHPVTRVTYRQVGDFVGRLNAMTGESYRLPTEDEWEYAARGGGLRRTWAETSDPERLYELRGSTATAAAGPSRWGACGPTNWASTT